MLYVAEHRWFDVVALLESRRTSGAAGDERRAFVDAGLDEPLNFVELDLAHYGAQNGLGRIWRADPLCGGDAFGDFQRFRVPVRGHEHSRRRVTRLAAVAETCSGTARYSVFQIRIRQDSANIESVSTTTSGCVLARLNAAVMMRRFCIFSVSRHSGSAAASAQLICVRLPIAWLFFANNT